eukprot:evm.model.NODE_17242_length_7764_cov_16.608450.2
MAHDTVSFQDMSETQLRQWVEAHPGQVNDKDGGKHTPLCVAVSVLSNLPLILWLIDEKGADVNVRTRTGYTPLQLARSLDILAALLERGANPVLQNLLGQSALIHQAASGHVDNVARLLQDSRVQATVNLKTPFGWTALHHACSHIYETPATAIVHLLLQAGANPAPLGDEGKTSLNLLRQNRPSHHSTIALLEQAPEAEKASLLVKARRLTVSAYVSIPSALARSYLQGRMTQRQPFPRVDLMPVRRKKKTDDHRKFSGMLGFLLGREGGSNGEGMPRDVFRMVMDFVMPKWDPLRRGIVGEGGEHLDVKSP